MRGRVLVGGREGLEPAADVSDVSYCSLAVANKKSVESAISSNCCMLTSNISSLHFANGLSLILLYNH